MHSRNIPIIYHKSISLEREEMKENLLINRLFKDRFLKKFAKDCPKNKCISCLKGIIRYIPK